MHALGRWIQQQLDARGWNRADLARRHADLSPSLLGKLITDDREHLDQTPQKRTLSALAEAFNVSLDEVLLVAAEAIGAPVGGLTVAPLSRATAEELTEEILIRLRSVRPQEVSSGEASPTPMTPPSDIDITTLAQDKVRPLHPPRVTRAARRAPRSDDD
ncbi:helix-turn-helix domain-containing protein [Labedaea rhizosphaerae]|uniref:HTH cro/C1-type domain-containing protein n=1 Tax=Labedaea rhizosphaerae TaxID=598644 RepID=A0A4R6SCJ8_LABRH|nr:helix-turn-helix transcriptional regulator [Labedaea rhizosphaerae]TDP97681.1 hypothetical protein EV186_103645 [Labedaea rhizosphaerae]